MSDVVYFFSMMSLCPWTPFTLHYIISAILSLTNPLPLAFLLFVSPSLSHTCDITDFLMGTNSHETFCFSTFCCQFFFSAVCHVLHRSATTLKPLTGEVKSTDYLATITSVSSWFSKGDVMEGETLTSIGVCSGQYIPKVVQGEETSEVDTESWTHQG